MLFADLFFLFFFLPVCVAVYFITGRTKYRNYVLIVFSLIFYAWGEPVAILILLASVIVNYFLARLIEDFRQRALGKAAFFSALVFNIGLLGVFKYTDFIIENINGIFGTQLPGANIALPLGISFYTFQALSYIIDVYWEKVSAQRKFHKLLMYISLFPQLVAGPIVRYETIADEIDRRKIKASDLSGGILRLIVGLSKKVLLANNLNLIAKACFGEQISQATVLGTWVGVIAYSMQVYFDFSGYSDMAIGMGRIFGFHFDENFRHPFVSRNITEFWQRWHISLGTFFRDYLLYIPIFGHRLPTVSLFIVWFTTGLWHGASWNYVLWGLYFGLFLFIETKLGKKRMKRIPTVLTHLYSKLVIIIGFGIFRFENIGELGNFFRNLIGLNANAFTNAATNKTITDYVFIFLISILACLPVVPSVTEFFRKRSFPVFAVLKYSAIPVCCVLLFLCTAVLVDTHATNNPFLYWNF